MEVRRIGDYIRQQQERRRLEQFDSRKEVSNANLFWLMQRIHKERFRVIDERDERNGIQIAISPDQECWDLGSVGTRAVSLTILYPSVQEDHLDVTELRWINQPGLDGKISITTSDRRLETDELLTPPSIDEIHRFRDGNRIIEVDYFNQQSADPAEAKRIEHLNSRLDIAYSLAFSMMRDRRLPEYIPRRTPLPTRRGLQAVRA